MKNLVKTIFVLAILIISSKAHAATITVDTFADDFDEVPPCSLREAVFSANEDVAFGGCSAGSGDDTIVLTTGTYTLTKSCDGINAPTAQGEDSISTESDSNTSCDDLDVYSNISVEGAGKELTIINVQSDLLLTMGSSEDYSFRVFDVHTEVFNSASLSASGFSQPVCEGACQQGTTLSLKSLAISGSFDSNGGAVRVNTDAECQYSKLVTDSVLFENNGARYNGGAVWVNGQYSATATVFDENSAGRNGGALYLNWSKQCPLTNSILSSVFDSNFSDGGLGGALFADTDVSVDIGNSTFQNNFAPVAGGAIAGVIGTINIANSSVANNGTYLTEGGSYHTIAGGGIFVGDLTELVNVKNVTARELETSGGDYEGQAGVMNLLIQGTQITNNTAGFLGGGMATVDGVSGTFRLDASSLSELGQAACQGLIKINTTVRDSVIKDNIVEFEEYFEADASENPVSPFFLAITAGGGIANNAYGLFNLENSTVDSNQAMGGGGIFNAFQMNIVKSTISNNQAILEEFISSGGGASINSNVFIPTINTFNFTGGGGIANLGYANITNSTISGNKTDGAGAGVLNFTDEEYSSLYFIILNQANDSGESEEFIPLEPIAAPGTNLNNDTIVNNEIVALPGLETTKGGIDSSVEETPTFYLNNGGGIAAVVGKITTSNTVIATNKDEIELYSVFSIIPVPTPFTDLGGLDIEPTPNATPVAEPKVILGGDFAPDCYSLPADSLNCEDSGIFEGICEFFSPGIVTLQHNLIGNNLGCTPFQPATNSNNDIVGTPDAVVNPLVGALANNGGATLSHLPLTGSPLIDNASGAALQSVAVSGRGCQPDDQRSIARPIDGNNDNIAVCDIGSLEVSVDCAGTVGGNLVKDGCGVCGGNGTSCIPPQNPDVPLSCVKKTVNNDLIVLDGSAHDLANLTNTLLRTVQNGGGKKANKQKKVSQEANALLNQAWTNTWSIPSEIVTECTGTGIKCLTLSNVGLKTEYQGTITKLYDLNKSLLNQLSKLRKVKAKNKKRLQDLNDKSYATALTTLGTIPDSTVSCSK